MFVYPEIDPVALNLGVWDVPFIGVVNPAIQWYGITYLVGFVLFMILGTLRARRKDTPFSDGEQVSDFLFFGAMGVIIGGRVGSVLFYNFPLFLENPLYIFKVWEGGMSFHGGLLGVIVAMAWYARSVMKVSFWRVADFVAPLVPTGLMMGRIGNFINGELWGGEVSESFIFSVQYDGVWRHPSMLYEAFGEGLLLFLVLWFYSRKQRPMMAVSGLFLLGYGLARFTVEFVRLPDSHLSYQLGTEWLTRGHMLTAPMILAGLAIMIFAYIKHPVKVKG